MIQNHPEEHNPIKSDHGSSANSISINFGGTTLAALIVFMLILVANGVVMGINIAERDSQKSQASQQQQMLMNSVEAERSAREDQYERLHDELVKTWRKYDLVEIQLRDQNAILIRNGWKNPGDTNHGPAGNLLYEPHGKGD